MLRVTVYRTWEEAQALQPHWNNLLSQSESDTIFLTWEWCSAWWKNYGTGRELNILGAWDGPTLIGVAPFYMEQSRQYGMKSRCLRLVGDGSHDSDYLNCFSQSSRETETIAAFGEFLQEERESWNWMEINGAASSSSNVAAWIAYAQERGWKCSKELFPCATLTLADSWDEYLRTLDSRFRTKVRSSLTSLTTALKSVPEQCASEHDMDAWLPTLFDLHTRRWAGENLPGVFGDAKKRSFYHDLSRAALQRGWLAFHKLSWGERPLALQYGLLYRNRFHLLQEGYDPEFSKIRPGMALRSWLICHWIEAGLAEYDFLAGAARHKLEWGARTTTGIRLRIAAGASGNLFAITMPRVRDQVHEMAGRALPEAVLSARRKALLISQRRTAGKNAMAVTHASSGTARHVIRRLVSDAYSSTPIGRIGRTVAARYALAPHARGWHALMARREQPVVHILQYHRVNDDRDQFLGGLPTADFHSQMRYLASAFPIVSLDQILTGECARHPYSVAVTFDDGYRDNFLCAFPILKLFAIPATVFLATGYIDKQELPWYDQVRLAFKLSIRKQISCAMPGGPAGTLDGLSERLRLMERTLAWLRAMPDSDRRSATLEVFEALGVPSSLNLPNEMLRWEDIRQMSKNGITFGAHTKTHPVLSKCTSNQLVREIETSKESIENRLQIPVSHFAYPFGQQNDLDCRVKSAVRAAGLKTGVTTIPGLNVPGDDLLELKRFTPWETRLSEFKLRMDWFRFSQPEKSRKTNSISTPASSIPQEVVI